VHRGDVERLVSELVNGIKRDCDLAPTLDDDAQKWNDRIDDAISMAGSIAKTPGTTTIGCFFEREPKGLAAISIPEDVPIEDADAAVWVDYIATHPMSSGAGGALIEQAVNMSAEAGFEGRLRLMSTSAAKEAYKALGFEFDTSGFMTLRPTSKQDVWILLDDIWRLRKYQTKDISSSIEQLRSPV
jgi:hypothetical protein